MASQKNLVILQNKETGEVYYTRKNKKLVERKLKYKKYSPKLRKMTWFEEVKKLSKLKKHNTSTQTKTNDTNKKEVKKEKVLKKEAKSEKKTKTPKKEK